MEGELPHIEREDRGVPVYWTALPGPVRGGMIFRAGRADETLAALGTSHLVEHLAMFAVGRTDFASNAFVDDTRTVFMAEGTGDEVATFLESIARALHELPLDRIEVERRILQTEAAGAGENFLGRLLSYRYGAATYGLAAFAELGLRWVGAEEVGAWVRERFTAGNAAMWMTAAPPSEFALELPPGDAMRPPEPVPRPRLRHPAWTAEGTGGVALTFAGRRSFALPAALHSWAERAHDRLRVEEGVTYNVDPTYLRLTAALAHVSLGADCIDENAERVRDGLQETVEAVAADGPTEEELARYVGGFDRALRDPDWALAALDGFASDHLYGKEREQPADFAVQLRELTTGEVADAAREALGTEILVVPEGSGPPSDRFEPVHAPVGEPLEGRTFRARRRVLRRPKGTLVLSDDAIGLVGGEVGPLTIRFADCAAVIEVRRGEYEVVGRDESFITFAADSLVGGEELERALRANVPAELFVPPDPRVDAVDEIAERKLKRRWTVGDEVTALPGLLRESERPVTMGEAARGLKAGLLVVTDQRVLWTYHGMRETVEEYPYESIRSVRTGGIFKEDKLVLETVGGTLKFTDVHPRGRAGDLVEAILDRVEA